MCPYSLTCYAAVSATSTSTTCQTFAAPASHEARREPEARSPRAFLEMALLHETDVFPHHHGAMARAAGAGERAGVRP